MQHAKMTEGYTYRVYVLSLHGNVACVNCSFRQLLNQAIAHSFEQLLSINVRPQSADRECFSNIVMR